MDKLDTPCELQKNVYDTTDFEAALKGYVLTTAEIFYHMPDHPVFIQSYLWQDFDLPPEFPRLKEFLSFWTQSIDGKLHSVRVIIGEHLVPQDVIAKIVLSL